MGKLLKPRGLKGELWMTIFNEVDSALKVGMQIWVASENGEFSNQIIESLKITEKKSWIKFELILTPYLNNWSSIFKLFLEDIKYPFELSKLSMLA